MSSSSDPDWRDHCGDLWRRHVLAATGFDIETITGPSPRRVAEWVAMMRRLGARSLGGVVSAVHGPPLASPRLARRGDIVRRGWAIGVCRGEQSEFYGGAMLEIGEAEESWRFATG